MIARRTLAALLFVLPLLGCDGVLDLRPATNDPDAGAAGPGGAGGRGGVPLSGTAGASGGGGILGGVGGRLPGRGGAAGDLCENGLIAYYPLDTDTKDHSGSGHDLVATDVSPVPGFVGGAVAFNGTTSAMQVTGGADFTLSTRTLCAWVKPNGVTGLAQPVFAGGSVGQGDVFALTSSTPATTAAPCMGSTEGQIFVDHGGGCTVAASKIAPSGQWSFVCWLYAGTAVEPLFANGTYDLTQGLNYTYPVSTLTIGSSAIGGGTTRPAFSGVIDEVTIWDRAVSPTEVNDLLNNRTQLTCGTPSTICHSPPTVLLTPGTTTPLMAGTIAPFDLAVTNTNSPSCGTSTFHYFSNTAYPLASMDPPGQLVLAPGETRHATVRVSSDPRAQIGRYPFSYVVYDDSESIQVLAPAVYLVGSVHVSTGVALVPDNDGHFDGSNAAGVVGSWWSTGDAYGSDNVPGSGKCPQAGFPLQACSALTTPTPGMIFKPDPNGRGMCTSGVSAQVIPDGTGALAYSSIWGNMIAFELNNPGTFDEGITTRMAYDAPAHGVTGFAFDIDAVPAGGHIRVNFPTVATELNAAYWGGVSMDGSPLAGPGHYEIRWPEVGGPMYLTNPPPFDPTQLISIAFLVYSNSFAPVPFDFCVKNLMMLTN